MREAILDVVKGRDAKDAADDCVKRAMDRMDAVQTDLVSAYAAYEAVRPSPENRDAIEEVSALIEAAMKRLSKVENGTDD